MMQTAISKGIRFDYLLVDSWFTCFDIIRFIVTRKFSCHFLGMIKMGITNYYAFEKHLTAKEIIDVLRRKKKINKSKLLGYYYAETTIRFKDIEVKLFFCKTSKKARWNAIITTNTKLKFEQDYKIYSIRWTIEVFFKESKKYLSLGKCQSQDFDAQIAAITISLIQYNILSVAKRFLAYETLGELFKQAQKDTLQLTISDKIWMIITELISNIAEIIETDVEMLMEKLLAESELIT